MDIQKVVTENPFVDNLLYYVKYLSTNAIIKNEEEMLLHETEKSIRESDLYIAVVENRLKFELATININILTSSGVPTALHSEAIRNRNSIPEKYRNAIVKESGKYIINNYVERNNYYRCILGLPDLGTPGITLRNYSYKLPSDIEIDLDKEIHTLDHNEIAIVEYYGIIDLIIKDNPQFKYLNNILKTLSIYDIRKAYNFQLLYLPQIDNDDIIEKYKLKYSINRNYVEKSVYSEAYKFQSDYYNNFMIILIVLQTMIDMLSELQEHIVKKDMLDSRCIEFIFASYGIPYFKEIPMRFQIKMVKNVNTLIKNKSCVQGMLDICSMFGFDDIYIFKYFLLKDRKLNSFGDYIYNNSIEYISKRNTDVMHLQEFISLPVENINDIQVPFPFPNYLEKGNVVFVRVDDRILQDTEYYITPSGVLLLNDDSIVDNKSNIIFEFYYDKETIDLPYNEITGDIIKIVHRDMPTLSNRQMTYSIPIPFEGYLDKGYGFIVSGGSVIISPDRYTINKTNKTITFVRNSNILLHKRLLSFIFIYSEFFDIRIDGSSKPIEYDEQNVFEVNAPFQNYLGSGNDCLVSIGTTLLENTRYLKSGEEINIIDSDTNTVKDRLVEYIYIYNEKNKYNKTTFKHNVLEIKADSQYQYIFNIKFPITNYLEKGNKIFVKLRGNYLDNKLFEVYSDSVRIIDRTISLNKGESIFIHYVYNEDESNNTVKSFLASPSSIGQSSFEIVNNNVVINDVETHDPKDTFNFINMNNLRKTIEPANYVLGNINNIDVYDMIDKNYENMSISLLKIDYDDMWWTNIRFDKCKLNGTQYNNIISESEFIDCELNEFNNEIYFDENNLYNKKMPGVVIFDKMESIKYLKNQSVIELNKDSDVQITLYRVKRTGPGFNLSNELDYEMIPITNGSSYNNYYKNCKMKSYNNSTIYFDKYEDCNLENMYVNITLSNSVFKNCNMRYAILNSIEDCTFIDCDLTGAIFLNGINNCTFENTLLNYSYIGNDLYMINDSKFLKCDFSKAIILTGIANCDFTRCDFVYTSFENTIDLSGYNITDVNFKNCNMKNCIIQPNLISTYSNNTFEYCFLNGTLFEIEENRIFVGNNNTNFINCDYKVTEDIPQFDYNTLLSRGSDVIVSINGSYIDSTKYVINGNNIKFDNAIYINIHDSIEFTILASKKNVYNIKLMSIKSTAKTNNQTTIAIRFPFYKYLETGNSFLLFINSTYINPSRYRITGNKLILDKAMKRGNSINIIYIYNSIYNRNDSALIVEERTLSIEEIKEEVILPIPMPFTDYIQNEHNYFLSSNGTFLKPDDYDQINNDITFTDIDKLEANGDDVNFTFIYKLTDLIQVIKENNEKDFNLRFVKVPLSDFENDKYIKDKSNYLDYDSITLNDPLWDGDDNSHYEIKKRILDAEFNYIRTKYLSVDAVYNLTELLFEYPYFFNMLFDDVFLEDKLTVKIPTISENKVFKLSHVFCYLFSIGYAFSGIKDSIMDTPSKVMYLKGFNFKADMEKIKEFIIDNNKELSEFEEAFKFKLPTEQIESIPKLIELFKTNKDVYNYVANKMLNARNKTYYDIWKKIYDSFMIIEFNLDYYKKNDGTKADTYTEFLKDKDVILYTSLLTIKDISDKDTREQAIFSIINDVVYILEEYLNSESFKYIYYNLPGMTRTAAVNYIFKLINFFKSYKVYLFETNVIYKLNGSGIFNSYRPIDNINVKSSLEYSDLYSPKNIANIDTTTTKIDKYEIKDKAIISPYYESNI